MVAIAVKIAVESWALLGQMAPYLLFGFLVAGVLSVCISPRLVERHLGGGGFMSVLKAALLGVPLPLCSCSVIPVAVSFRRHGASRAATASFLFATPQIGVDSIAVTYALLGAVFAVYRPVVALAGGLLVGALVMLLDRRNNNQEQSEVVRPQCHECCCEGKERQNVFVRVFKYGLVELPRDVGWQLLLGVLVAGTIAAVAPVDLWGSFVGGGIASILAAMAIGVPVYVCSSASVPLALGLMHMGASPGTALAFLIAGPATNAATIAAMWKFLGGRAMLLYLLTIALSAVLGGLTLDWLFATLNVAGPMAAEHAHHTPTGAWLSSAWAILLLAILAFSFLAKTRNEMQDGESDE